MSEQETPWATEPEPTTGDGADAAARPAVEPAPDSVAGPPPQNGTPAPSTRTAAGDDEGDRADAFTEQRSAAQYGQRLIRGAAAAGHQAKATYIATQQIFRIGEGFEFVGSRFESHYLIEETASYVEVAAYGVMARLLRERNLLLVYGSEGSGRRATGLRLLTELCPPDRIGTIALRDTADLAHLCRYDDFAPGDGHLVDLTGGSSPRPVRQATLETLANRVRDAKTYLVVLVDEVACPEPGPLRSFLVEHGRPEPALVLRHHLEHGLDRHLATCRKDDCAGRPVERYVDKQVEDPLVRPHLHDAAQPWRLAELARVLVDNIHADRELNDLLDDWRPELRPLAREILAPAPDEDGQERPYLLSRRQAFRLAYTVFNGHPHADVFRAADILYREVLPRYEVREENLRHLVVDGDVEKLLHRRMVAPHGDDSPRSAQLADPKLLRLVLEVAWYEYDSLRAPMLIWLSTLVQSGRIPVQVRAAQIGGLLATFDFTEVYRDLIGAWARGSTVAYRTAAAHAMAIAYLDEDLEKRVLEQVRSWATSGVRYADSAARAYGTVIGLADPAATLDSLAEMGRRPAMAASSAVATSTASLFLTGHADQVIDALGDWIVDRSEHLHDHAVRTLLLLAQISLDTNAADWPVRPDLAADTEARQEALVRLWQRALVAAGSSVRAWDRLRRWLVRDDADDALNASLLALTGQIFDGPLRQRARFHLTLWRRNGTQSPLIDDLYALVTRTQ